MENIIKILLELHIFDQKFNKKMSIGSQVRKYRDIKKLTQSMLAENVEVSQSVISSLESDKSIPNSVMLNNIAKALDVDINNLLVHDNIFQNSYDKAIGHIHNHVTIKNHFPENIFEILLSNQEKITNMLETQNKLIESFLKK